MISAKKKQTSREWLHAHVNYNGPDCLIWPFSRQPTGYGAFSDRSTGERETHYAHRYMCELVNGAPPDPIYEAAHSCGRGNDGCVDPRHLSWKTISENARDCRAHGTEKRNRWGWKGKMTRRQVDEIWSLKSRETQAVIAAKMNVSPSTVRDIFLGRTHLGMTAVSMLRKLSERDLGSFKNFSSGLWSRRNLEAMIDDLVVDTNNDQSIATGQSTQGSKE